VNRPIKDSYNIRMNGLELDKVEAKIQQIFEKQDDIFKVVFQLFRLIFRLLAQIFDFQGGFSTFRIINYILHVLGPHKLDVRQF
jgi:heme oxygenase